MPRTGLSADELKERAIDAALARIRLVGFDKVRLSDVARDIGVSHAALYAHFADKAALLDAVTERWLSRVEDALAAVACLPLEPAQRIVEWLVTLYRMKRSRALADPEPHRAFDVAAALDKPFVVAHLEKLLDQLTRLFAEAGMALGTGDPRRKAGLLYSATAAYHHPTLIAQTAPHDFEPQLRDIVTLLFRGMRAA